MIAKVSAILILVLVVMVSGACASVFTVSLLDCSQSVVLDAKSKDSPFHKNLQEMKREIERQSKNDRYVAIAFGKKSAAQILDVTMPRIAGPKENNLKVTRVKALRKLQENLETEIAQIDKDKTDLLGSLSRAARILSESDASIKRITIYSDCIDTETLKLSMKKLTAGSHKRFLKRLDTAGVPYPKLQKVSVTIYASLASDKNLSGMQHEIAINELRLLWTEVLNRCGARISTFRTSMY
jgi:uncharacterized membrane-anchored protein YhcB (DUF1043 family)